MYNLKEEHMGKRLPGSIGRLENNQVFQEERIENKCPKNLKSNPKNLKFNTHPVTGAMRARSTDTIVPAA